MRLGLLPNRALSGQLSRNRAAIHQRCCSSGTGLQTCWVAWSSGQSDRSRKGRVLPASSLPARRLVSSCQGPPSLTCFPGSCGSGWVGPGLGVLPKSRWLWGQKQCLLLLLWFYCEKTFSHPSVTYCQVASLQTSSEAPRQAVAHCSSLYVHERLGCPFPSAYNPVIQRSSVLCRGPDPCPVRGCHE